MATGKATAGFRGWPAEALDFYDGLAADNTKTYWLEHKAVYERCVKEPFEALLAELGGGKLFRPFRDVRFSADKSPYKTAAAAHINGDGGGYVQLSVEGLFVGTGYYWMAADQLARYRAAVADHAGTGTGEELVRLVEAAEKGGLTVGGEALKTAPKGYPKDHPRIRFLRHKGLYVGQTFPPAPWLGTAKAKDRILSVIERARPLQAWLDTQVGESTEPPDERGRS